MARATLNPRRARAARQGGGAQRANLQHALTLSLLRPLADDTDCQTWSPAGRIHQIEYAMEAVKQGSAAIGLRSNTYAVLATLKRAPSELSSHQKKVFEIDEHIGIAIAGATSPAATAG